MDNKRIHYALCAALLVASAAGCKQSESNQTAFAAPSAPAPATSPAMETVGRIHWLGKKQLAAETNAAAFMRIWNLPESVKLQTQTLDKLSSAPWRLLRGDTNQPSTNLLRPLLDDLVQEESYLEIRDATNQ